MAGLQNFSVTRGGVDHSARPCDVVRDGFFDQYVETTLDQAASDAGMSDGRGSDNCGVGIGGELFERIKRRTAVSGGSAGCAGRIGIENACQARVFGSMNDAEMIAAERSGSNDGDASLGHCTLLDPRKRVPRKTGLPERCVDGAQKLKVLTESTNSADCMASCVR